MRSLLAASLLVFVSTACEPEKDYLKEKPPAEGVTTPSDQPPPPPKPKKNPVPADLGKCTLEVTGGVEAKAESPGGREATNISYWFTPEERKNMMGVDGYVVNCKGEGFRFSLLPGGGTPDGMPFKPKTFNFKKGRSDGASVMAAFGQATLTDAEGVVDITALDARHIAGTVNLSGKVIPGNKKVTIKGSFDLVCPGYSACDFGEAQ